MSEIQRITFGSINDQDESLKGKSGGGSFGLNESVNITKLEYNPNAGKDNGPGDAVDITVLVGEKEFRRRMYDVTRIFDNSGNQMTDENDPEYIKKYNENMTQTMAVIVHAVKATGVTQQQIDAAVGAGVGSFAEWAKAVTSLVPADMDKRPVDFFAEYQWKIAADNDKTYLEVPKNMKGGYFLVPAVPPQGGQWTEERQWEATDSNGITKTHKGLRYVDGNGNVHPFTRSDNYMESPKGYQQIDGQENSAQTALNNASPVDAKKSSW